MLTQVLVEKYKLTKQLLSSETSAHNHLLSTNTVILCEA